MSDLKNFFNKMKGGKTCPPRAPLSEIIWSTVGGFLGIAAIYTIGHIQGLQLEHNLFLVGSFGASAVLLYGIPLSPFAQPRNLIGGHMISAVIGVSFYLIFPQQIVLSASLAVGIAIGVMHLTRTLHPPGGATALIAVIGGNAVHQLGFLYVITPIGLGASIMLLVALLVNNLAKGRHYPEYWL
jgi:CBS domain-containing membrane protein